MFQVLDEKKYCVGIYKDGELYYGNIPDDLDKTWNYSSFLSGKDIEYAFIYSEGKSLDDCCPKEIEEEWKKNAQKMRAHFSSIIKSKISLKDNCFFNLVPERVLKEHCELKNKICHSVFSKNAKPKEYNFLREFNELVYNISFLDLNINKDKLLQKIYLPQASNLLEKINKGQTTVKYNIFNSVTGRLTVKDNSFPILNLNTKLRDVIEPKNDWLVSIDLNAAEMRIALALAGQSQPTEDLHEFVMKKVFNSSVTRAQAKTISTQWLYGSKNDLTLKYNLNLNDFYNKQKLISDYYSENSITTPYHRKIDCDFYHAISYLCQSTLIDMWHRQLLKCMHLFLNKKSFLSFMLHDQVIFDLCEQEKNILPELIKILSDTPYGTFPVKVEIGKNFMDMKKVNIKV